MGTALLLVILGGTTWAIYTLAKRDLSLAIRVCRGHGGDGIEKCPLCREVYCRECQPEGHCIHLERNSWIENS